MGELLTLVLAILVLGLFVIPTISLVVVAGLSGLPLRAVAACRRHL